MACEAKPAHSLDDGIEQAEKDEAEIVFFEQQALGTAGADLGFDGSRLNFSETPPEIVQKFPTGELFLVDDGFGIRHGPMRSWPI